MNSRIRVVQLNDAAAIQEIYAPFCSEDSPTSFEMVPPSVEEMCGRISNLLPRFPWLVCEVNNQIAGYVYAGIHHERAAYQWSANVAVYIHPSRRRIGVGRALYTSLFHLLAAQGIYNAYAGITIPNPGSIGLHESLGFKLVGIYRNVGFKVGKWQDVGWWHLQLRPAEGQPTNPVPFSNLTRDVIENAIATGERLLRPNC